MIFNCVHLQSRSLGLIINIAYWGRRPSFKNTGPPTHYPNFKLFSRGLVSDRSSVSHSWPSGRWTSHSNVFIYIGGPPRKMMQMGKPYGFSSSRGIESLLWNEDQWRNTSHAISQMSVLGKHNPRLIYTGLLWTPQCHYSASRSYISQRHRRWVVPAFHCNITSH